MCPFASRSLPGAAHCPYNLWHRRSLPALFEPRTSHAHQLPLGSSPNHTVLRESRKSLSFRCEIGSFMCPFASRSLPGAAHCPYNLWHRRSLPTLFEPRTSHAHQLPFGSSPNHTVLREKSARSRSLSVKPLGTGDHSPPSFEPRTSHAHQLRLGSSPNHTVLREAAVDRQSGPRPESIFLRQSALEDLMDFSHERILLEKFIGTSPITAAARRRKAARGGVGRSWGGEEDGWAALSRVMRCKSFSLVALCQD
ncbi:hypothetical protein F511_07848 [Dorcoceras hygrometricum]|uniref:Uncharacterized protein n=1 Tax=Dorcoceras hygrometricum TaxID=472368 RepID=A0A2Z7B628_9LAMI|nr:hypothetical protein F511_07848 [Dorcoceras hygrometricum]